MQLLDDNRGVRPKLGYGSRASPIQRRRSNVLLDARRFCRQARGSRCIERLLRPVDVFTDVAILERANHHQIDLGPENGAELIE